MYSWVFHVGLGGSLNVVINNPNVIVHPHQPNQPFRLPTPPTSAGIKNFHKQTVDQLKIVNDGHFKTINNWLWSQPKKCHCVTHIIRRKKNEEGYEREASEDVFSMVSSQ